MADSSRMSFSVRVQRAWGLRCQVPTPEHGASTRMPSNLVLVGRKGPPFQVTAR